MSEKTKDVIGQCAIGLFLGLPYLAGAVLVAFFIYTLGQMLSC